MKYIKNNIQNKNIKRCIICNKPYTYNYDLFGRNCLSHLYKQLNIKIPKFISNKEWYLCKILSYKNLKFFLSKRKRYSLVQNCIIQDYLNKINLKSLEDYRKKVAQNIKNINLFKNSPSILVPYTVNDFYKIYNDYNKFKELLNTDIKDIDETVLKSFSIIFDIDKMIEPLYHSFFYQAQCIFWETIVIGGFLKQMKLSAYLMQLSLSNSGEYENQNNILIIDNLKITNIFMNNDEFKNLLNSFLLNSSTINIQNKKIEFNKGDLLLSIHKATIDILGEKKSNNAWDLEINIHDKYDFTDIKNLKDYVSSTNSIKMSLFSSTLNNFAAISSSYGVLKTFNFMIKMKIENYKIESE